MQNIFIDFLPPWVETGLQPAFYDKESGTVLQQVARMYAKVNQLVKAFDDLDEATVSTVNEYITKFTELHDYVHDYFDNLDVQEEINTKLDDMAEQGQLADIISQYLNSTAVFGYDTVADMKDGENLVNGSYARTLGYYAKNDGGGATYKIRTITNDDVIDEGSIIEMNDSGNTLIAELIFQEDTSVLQFGAKGDGVTDDSTAFANMYNATNKIYVPKGTYLAEITINTANAKIYGDGSDSIIKGKINSNVITLGEHANTYEIKDITIDGDHKSNYCIYQGSYNTTDRYDCHGVIKRCEIKNALIDGIFICNNARENRYLDNYIHSNGNNGFTLCASDSFITNCTFSSNGNNGIELKQNTLEIPANSDNNIITGCKAFYNGAEKLNDDSGNGFQICSSRNVLTNCDSQENFGSGFYLEYLSESNNLTSILSDGNGTASDSQHDSNAYGVHIKGANNIVNGSVNNALLEGGISAVVCFDGKYAFNNNVDLMFTNYTAQDTASYGLPNCILVKNTVDIPFNRIKINGESKDIGTESSSFFNISHSTVNDYPASSSSATASDGVITVVMNGYVPSDTNKTVAYRATIWNDFPTNHTVYLKCKAKITGVDKNNGFDARVTLTTGYTDTSAVVHRYIGGKYYNTGKRYSHILRNVNDWQDVILVADCSTVDTLADYQSLWGMLIGFELFKNGATTISSDVTVQFKDLEYLLY